MSRRASARATRRRSTSALLAAGLSALLSTSALAAVGNRVHNEAPSHVTVGQKFTVRLIGHTTRRAWLYLWLDGRPCAATPAGEQRRLRGLSTSLPGGSFDRTSRWTATHAGTAHVCSYLSKGSEPRYARRGVLAHDFTTIKQT